MTKQHEIESLKAFALSLPMDSYLRPWIESVIPQVESEIRSDFYPSPSISETRKFCEAEIKFARTQADGIKQAAVEQAKKHLKEADDRYDRITRSIYDVVHSCERSLQGI